LAYDIVSAQVAVLERENPADIEISEHQLQQAQIAFQTAETNKLQLEADRKNFEAAEARVREADATLQQALAAQSAKTWQREIDLAKANMRRAEASLELAKQRLQYCTITAPISGVITARNLDPGDMVTSAIGRFTALVTIANIDPVRVISNIAEREVNLIRVGSEAKIKADAYPNREFVGEVIQISPIVDQATRTAKIEIKVPNSERLLKPGMFVRIDLVLDERSNVVLVPKHALKTIRGKDGEKKGVFLVKGEQASFVSISTGLESDEAVEVIAGVNQGNMIVVSGHQSGGLRDGSKVIVTNK
jgi:membrane fusion protein (multidrug efflux system)